MFSVRSTGPRVERGRAGCTGKSKVTSPDGRVSQRVARLACRLAGEVSLGLSGQSGEPALDARAFRLAGKVAEVYVRYSSVY